MKLSNIFTLAALALGITATAQTTIGFETADYKKLGVYDTWEESPFRTGVLQGNYAVVDNPDTEVEEILGEAPNASAKVLAVQRSRFGSNTFGVRIDLNETFELTPTAKYLHVMIHRPYSGRVMVVGLGKRTERAGQSPETEQFWAMSTTNIPGGHWQDVVLPIKGNGGIDIYSLVVVPDCESPHNYTEDAICYIDNVEVNNDPSPKFSYAFYPINFEKTQTYTRNDRRVNSIALASPKDGSQSYSIPSSSNYIYNNVTEKTFTARAGEVVTPTFDYDGSWMHGYVYIDTNNDGKFNAAVTEDYNIAEGSEIMAYSFYGKDDNGKNSAGTTLTGQARNVLNPPTFTIPANLKNGYYRMRYKVDWNCVDPAGNIDTANPIVGNGGGIVDIRLNIHGDFCNVNDANRNGEVLTASGEKLVKYQAPFGQPFTIKMNPEQGFEYAGVIVKHGYNLSGDSVVSDNVQWERVRISREAFNENDEYTIPAELMDGDVEIEGLFIETGTYKPDARYEVTKVEGDNFAAGVTWYTIQIGSSGYVLANNGDNSYIALDNTTIDTNNAAHLWCFTGNNTDGYRLYNMQTGTAKVLAAPIEMRGTTGSGSYPTMQPVNAIPTGYTDVWMFADSRDMGSTNVAYAYMYEKGYEANKVNNRDNRLAFWNGGQDAGSTLSIFPAQGGLVSGVDGIRVEVKPATAYDLSGRLVNNPKGGIYIIGGKKQYVK